MKNTIILFSLVIVTRLTFSQNLSFYGFLPAISQTGRISKKLNYNLFASTTVDAIEKRVNSVEYPASDLQLYIQPSLIYTYAANLNFAGSYTYQRNNPFNGNFTNEHRLWQQFIYSIPVSKGKITNRIRLEERFIENKITGKYPYFTRIRYQIGFNIPLQGKTLDEHEFYFNSYNEFYFTLTGVRNATYSDNWTYSGLGYSLGKLGKLEFGYLLQTSVRNKQKDLRFFNLAQFMWSTNFNFKKK
jgi:hypothetical protein